MLVHISGDDGRPARRADIRTVNAIEVFAIDRPACQHSWYAFEGLTHTPAGKIAGGSIADQPGTDAVMVIESRIIHVEPVLTH